MAREIFSRFGVGSRRAIDSKRTGHSKRRLFFEACEMRCMLAGGSIAGTKFTDVDGGGFSGTNVPKGGVTIQLYKDNGDGTFDQNVDSLAGTQVTATGTGAYAFSNLADGRYFVKEVIPTGFTQTGGPAFYTVDVVGGQSYLGTITNIDTFESPTPADVFTVTGDPANPTPNPDFLQESGTGIIGDHRNVLINVVGNPNPVSAQGFIGTTSGRSVFNLGTASSGPGTEVTLLYDGSGTDTVIPPGSISNSEQLNSDLTGGGVATGLKFDFNFLQNVTQSALDVQITANGASGSTTFSGVIQPNTGGFSYFVPYSSFVPTGTFSFSSVTSLQVKFNAGGVQEADFELDNIEAATQQSTGFNFANQQTSLPDLTVAKSHTDIFHPGDVGDHFTITVSNVGAFATSGQVSLTDILPAGLTATAFTGSGWFVDLSTLTAIRTDSLAAGASYPALTLTVNVASTATGTLVNTATVSGGGETNTSNDTATDSVTLVTTPQSASVSGFVYVDSNNNGIKESTELPISGVTVTLTGTDNTGASVTKTTTTDALGAYSFPNLVPGSYVITETQPINFVDGKVTAGSQGGTTGVNVISAVTLANGTNGVSNNFGELGLTPSFVTKRLYLDPTATVSLAAFVGPVVTPARAATTPVVTTAAVVTPPVVTPTVASTPAAVKAAIVPAAKPAVVPAATPKVTTAAVVTPPIVTPQAKVAAVTAPPVTTTTATSAKVVTTTPAAKPLVGPVKSVGLTLKNLLLGR